MAALTSTGRQVRAPKPRPIPSQYRPKLPAPKPKPSIKFPTVGKGTQRAGHLAIPVPAKGYTTPSPKGRVPSPAPSAAAPKPKVQLSPYANPFAGDTGVVGQRIDQGVDYSAPAGTPIRALGPGKISISTASGSGWPGGGFIGEVLGAGPVKGQTSYVAEDVRPAVAQGQTVKAGQTIGYFAPGGSIETGFGAPGQDQALAYVKGQSDYSGSDPGAYSTGYGIAYNKLLTQLGAPSGTLQSVISGTAPPKFSSTGGQVVGVKPTSAPKLPAGIAPIPAPSAGSVPIGSSTGEGAGGGTVATRARTTAAKVRSGVNRALPWGPTGPPQVFTPPPALGGTTPGVGISSGSLTGNVINNGLPGFTPTTQTPPTSTGTSVGPWLIGAAVLGGVIYYMAKKQAT